MKPNEAIKTTNKFHSIPYWGKNYQKFSFCQECYADIFFPSNFANIQRLLFLWSWNNNWTRFTHYATNLEVLSIKATFWEHKFKSAAWKMIGFLNKTYKIYRMSTMALVFIFYCYKVHFWSNKYKTVILSDISNFQFLQLCKF